MAAVILGDPGSVTTVTNFERCAVQHSGPVSTVTVASKPHSYLLSQARAFSHCKAVLAADRRSRAGL